MAKCGWCGCKDCKIVPDGIYDHHICTKCHHEWDTVTKDKGRIAEHEKRRYELFERMKNYKPINSHEIDIEC